MQFTGILLDIHTLYFIEKDMLIVTITEWVFGDLKRE